MRAPARRPPPAHHEVHRFSRIGWLRAAVLGADDGIVSTAALMIGVAASSASRNSILVAGIAGLAAGALSMGAGEYVSVSSQRDTERADIQREQRELAYNRDFELGELTDIYVKRGLDENLARTVAKQLTASDALGAHVRDELGIVDEVRARPWQAARVSSLSFLAGGTLPVVAMLAAPSAVRAPLTAAVALVLLAVLGWLGGRIGGAPGLRPAMRVLIGGGIAMGVAAGIGALLGTAV
jgi:VIT1/CCC1 family predicted Fe2+/Mn2+ transporter